MPLGVAGGDQLLDLLPREADSYVGADGLLVDLVARERDDHIELGRAASVHEVPVVQDDLVGLQLGHGGDLGEASPADVAALAVAGAGPLGHRARCLAGEQRHRGLRPTAELTLVDLTSRAEVLPTIQLTVLLMPADDPEGLRADEQDVSAAQPVAVRAVRLRPVMAGQRDLLSLADDLELAGLRLRLGPEVLPLVVVVGLRRVSRRDLQDPGTIAHGEGILLLAHGPAPALGFHPSANLVLATGHTGHLLMR